ncbi:hypothetical protein GQ42DRAFT_577 [Ramicandelaber brevisporus]|nr:hypothetical protein GQ42DRAFT_577 [Ramicandelaber brevisporus]
MNDVLKDYTMYPQYCKSKDWMALEWIFKLFMELGYTNLFYLITGRGYKDTAQESVITMSMNWEGFLHSKDSRRVLSRFVETYKYMRLSILLDDDGTWWKMLVRDKNRHLLKRLYELETESFSTSDILEYAKSKEVKGKKEHLIEMLEKLEIANK